ncbi:MAG: hypothetical protein SVW57_13595 [Thermodesulfobacteriota bacterium]|nr:hypothetical protein [Thermodesulfobacteriota bacterium]
MEYFTIEFCEMALDVLGLFLCGITMLYLIKGMVSDNQGIPQKKIDGNVRRFDREVLIQLIKQQIEKAFRSISETMKSEREVLYFLIEHGETGKTRKRFPIQESEQPGSPGSCCSVSDKYGEVARLVDLGLSGKEISERVEIPRGEIDLVIDLKNKGNE